jgi:Co/Zn/Cd efflux system component
LKPALRKDGVVEAMTSASRPFALAAALHLGFVALEVAASQWPHSAALLADG